MKDMTGPKRKKKKKGGIILFPYGFENKKALNENTI